jgi:flagellar basal-body rod protein FlgF
MERGSYTAASLGLFQHRKLEIVNNNLANLSTPGFKREVLVGDTQPFEDTLASEIASNDPYARGDHDQSPAVINLRSVTDFSQGPIRNTGNPLDAALASPNDFFVVGGPGGLQYTRAGAFTLNSQGELVTPDGAPVQGDGGAIAVTGVGAEITENGGVRVNGAEVGRLQVVTIADPSKLERVGNTRFVLAKGTPPPEQVEPKLLSRSLEMANVSTIGSVVDLMTTSRAFDLYTKAAQSIDQLNQSAINQVGRRSA